MEGVVAGEDAGEDAGMRGLRLKVFVRIFAGMVGDVPSEPIASQ